MLDQQVFRWNLPGCDREFGGQPKVDKFQDPLLTVSIRILMGSLPLVKSKWASEATKQRESYYVTFHPVAPLNSSI